MSAILVVNGPNLDILGKREEDIYGKVTIDEINHELKRIADEKGIDIEFFQSNHEGDIVEKITSSLVDGILINPAAYTHTSVAIRDALSARGIPAIEVHLSNIYAREEFRHKSLIAPVVTGQVSGLGKRGYLLALEALMELVHEN
jgi:3-dehydroquinate dehydratase II